MRRDGCLEGTPNWRIARFGWMCLWKDGTFVWGGRGIGAGAWFGWGVVVEGRDFCFGGTGLLFWGDAELAQERDSAGCVCEFVGRMIYIQAGQSLTSRACSTVGGAN